MNSATELIKADEGLRLKPYLCPAGKLTLGWGRNIQDVGIYLDEAEYLLSGDIRRVTDRCALLIVDWAGYDEVRQAVFLNMAFNMGISGLLKFKKLLLAAHMRDWKKAHDEILDSDAARELPERYGRLAKMMLKGEWPA